MADRTKIEAAINVLPTKVQSSHPRFEKNMREMARLVAEVRNQEQQIAEGGGAKAIETQHAKKRLTARERIGLLIDREANCLSWALMPPGRCTTSGAERHRPASSPAWTHTRPPVHADRQRRDGEGRRLLSDDGEEGDPGAKHRHRKS